MNTSAANSGLVLVKPAPAFLEGCKAALRAGWSSDSVRAAAASAEELARIEADADGYLALLDKPEGGGAPVTLPDGSQVQRLPWRVRWLWDGEFCGMINVRWQWAAPNRATTDLPPHVMGHAGYSVVPWKRRRGYATQALRLMLPIAREIGLNWIDLTTDPDNLASQKVITANGGVLVEHFTKPAAYGGGEGLRFRVALV